LYTIEFSLEQLGQVNLITYPDLVPITVGFSLFFIMILCLCVVCSTDVVTQSSLSLTRYMLYAQGIPRRTEEPHRFPIKMRFFSSRFFWHW